MDLDDAEESSVPHLEEKSFLEAMALFYLKLQAKLLLPASTIQEIISELHDLHLMSRDQCFFKLKEKLSVFHLDDGVSSSIIEELRASDLWTACHGGPLRTDQTRKTFFKSQFNFIYPQPIYLAVDENGVDKFMQYLPVKDTLRSLWESQHIMEKPVSETIGCDKIEVFRDVHDGTVFQNNPLFASDPTAFQLLLYADAFEVVNPLGSGRKKHKIEAMYLTLANFPAHCT